MLVEISIEKTQPLTGTASAGGKGPVSFVGWLDLLRAIAELAGTPGQSVDASREADDKPAQGKVGDRKLS